MPDPTFNPLDDYLRRRGYGDGTPTLDGSFDAPNAPTNFNDPLADYLTRRGYGYQEPRVQEFAPPQVESPAPVEPTLAEETPKLKTLGGTASGAVGTPLTPTTTPQADTTAQAAPEPLPEPEVKPEDVPLLGALAKMISPADPSRAPIVGGLASAISNVTRPTSGPKLAESLGLSGEMWNQIIATVLGQGAPETEARQLGKEIGIDPTVAALGARAAGVTGGTLNALLTPLFGLGNELRDAPLVGTLYRAGFEAPMNVLNEATTQAGGALKAGGEILGRGITDVAGMYGAQGGIAGLTGPNSRVQEYFAKLQKDARDVAQGKAVQPQDYFSGAFGTASANEQLFLSLVNPVNVIDLLPLGELQKLRSTARATGKVTFAEARAFGKTIVPRVEITGDAPLVARMLFDLPKIERTPEGAVKVGTAESLGIKKPSWWERVVPSELTQKAKGFEMLRRTLDNMDARFGDMDATQYQDLLERMAYSARTGELAKEFFDKYPNMVAEDARRAIRLTGDFDIETSIKDIDAKAAWAQEAIEDSARDIKKMPKIWRDAVTAIREHKGGYDAATVLDQVRKVELRTAWGKHVATGIREGLGIKDPGMVQRMFDSLRSWEGALYIGLNPGAWVRNGVQNKTNLAFYGINPRTDFNKIEATYKALGWDPFSEANEIAREVIGKRESNTGMFGASIPQKIADALPFFENVEKADRKRAYWSGFDKALRLNWRRGHWFQRMPVQLERDLRAVHPRLPDLMYGEIERGRNPQQVLEGINGVFKRVAVESFLDDPEFQTALAQRFDALGVNADTARLIAADHLDGMNEAVDRAFDRSRRGELPLARALDEEFAGERQALVEHVTKMPDDKEMRQAARTAAYAQDPEYAAHVEQSARQGSIPFVITRDMRQQLYDLRYSADEVNRMTPPQAQRVLQEGRVNPARGQGLQAAPMQTAEQFSPDVKSPVEQGMPSVVPNAQTAPTTLDELTAERGRLWVRFGELANIKGKAARAEEELLLDRLTEIESQIPSDIQSANPVWGEQVSQIVSDVEETIGAPIAPEAEARIERALDAGYAPEDVARMESAIAGETMPATPAPTIYPPQMVPDYPRNEPPLQSDFPITRPEPALLPAPAPRPLLNPPSADELARYKEATMPPTMDEFPAPELPEVQLDARQRYGVQYLASLKKADGTPRFTEQQIRAWRPEYLDLVLAGAVPEARDINFNLPRGSEYVYGMLYDSGALPPSEINALSRGAAIRKSAELGLPVPTEMGWFEPTIEDLRAFASGKVHSPEGIGTISNKGAAYDSHILSVLNNWRPFGMDAFDASKLAGQVEARVDAWNVLNDYVPHERRTYDTPLTRGEFWDEARRAFRNLSDEQFDLTREIVDRWAATIAKTRGWTLDEAYAHVFGGVEPGKASGGLQQADAPRWYYSQLTRVIDGLKQDKFTAEQLRGMLKGKVKPDEMKWTGFDDWMNEHPKATKQEALEYLRDNNVQVQEVVKGENIQAEMNRVAQQIEARGYTIEGDPSTPDFIILDASGDDIGDNYDVLPKDLQQLIERYSNLFVRQEMPTAKDTKYAQYTLPGGENYRELLLTYPFSPEVSRAIAKGSVEGVTRGQFRSSHWDEPNILAHVRFNERTTADGKRMLFIEEIQSDWAQAGRDKGFKGDFERTLTPEEKELQSLNAQTWTNTPLTDAQEARRKVLVHEVGVSLQEKARKAGQLIPDMPFANTYEELALKRILRYASENGYDAVGWTTGAQQAERYNLAKQVKSVAYHPKEQRFVVFDLNGGVPIDQKVTPEKLVDYIGKDAAKRLLDQPIQKVGGAEFHSLSGDGLQVGGEGMKAAYDKRLVNKMNDLAKKFGGKVGDADIPTQMFNPKTGVRQNMGMDRDFAERLRQRGTLEFKTENVHSIAITPEMRESVLRDGFPLFQGKGEKGSTQFLTDGRALVRAVTEAHDVSTAVHEVAHAFLPFLPREELAAFETWTGLSDGEFLNLHGRYLKKEITLASKDGVRYRNAQEQFARGFEKYLHEGKAPTPELKSLFDRFAQFLRDIYGMILGEDSKINVKLTDEMRGLYGRLLDAENYLSPSERAAMQKAVMQEARRGVNIASATFSQGFLTKYFRPDGEPRAVWFLPDAYRRPGQDTYVWGAQRPKGEGWKRQLWTEVTDAADRVTEVAWEDAPGAFTERPHLDDIVRLAEQAFADKGAVKRAGTVKTTVPIVKAGAREVADLPSVGTVTDASQAIEDVARPAIAEEFSPDVTIPPAPVAPELRDAANDYLRRDIDAMSDVDKDEAIRALREKLLTDKTGIGSAYAYATAPKRAIQAHSDVDGLKWINDNLSHDAGDALLKAKADALRAEGVEAYHISGDEFIAQFDNADEARAAMERAATRLKEAEIVVTVDGQSHIYKGASYSYGIGQGDDAAEQALKQHKDERFQLGERGQRGEKPRGLVESTASESGVIEGRNGGNTVAAEEGIARSRTDLTRDNAWQTPLSEWRKWDTSGKVPIENHRVFVEKAIQQGKPVPAEVLADYPDLAAKYGKQAEGAFAGRGAEIRARLDDISASVVPEARNLAPVKEKNLREISTPPANAEPLTLKSHAETVKRMYSGEMSADDIKQAYQRFKENRETLRAELSARTLKQLAPNGTGGMKKSEVVDKILDNMRNRYTMGEGISWIPTDETYETALERVVNNLTDDKIKTYLADLKQRSATRQKALTNPETLDEFRTFIDNKGIDALSPEQRTQYETMQAEWTRGQRQKDAERNATIRPVTAPENVTGKLVEGKHGKTGETLHIVQLEGGRLEDAAFKELAQKARQLGGNYVNAMQARMWKTTAGFQFKDAANAEKFMGLLRGESVSGAERLAEKQAERVVRTGEKLRALAERMEESANEKLGRDRLANTARRARMADSAESAARADLALAQTIRNIADAIDAGEVKLLNGVTAKTHVETLDSVLRDGKYKREKALKIPYSQAEGAPATLADVDYVNYPIVEIRTQYLRDAEKALEGKRGQQAVKWLLKHGDRNGEYALSFAGFPDGAIEKAETVIDALKETMGRDAKYTADNIAGNLEDVKRLRAMNLKTQEELRAALREYFPLKQTRQTADPIKQMERKLIGTKIEGYFPTPTSLADELIARADIQPNMTVLEPSAGKGNLADAVKRAAPDAKIDVVERVSSLRDILKAKGYNLVADDFLEHAGTYDRIVMNPPFENGQDAEHVMRAYEMLKPNGKLVAIMGEGTFSRSDKKATAFREWLDRVNGTSERLPDGSFASAERPTGVATRLVEIEKQPEAIAPVAAVSQSAPQQMWIREEPNPLTPTKPNYVVYANEGSYAIGSRSSLEEAQQLVAERNAMPIVMESKFAPTQAPNAAMESTIAQGDIVRFNNAQVEVTRVHPDGSLELSNGEVTTPRKVELVAKQEGLFGAEQAAPQENVLELQSQEAPALPQAEGTQPNLFASEAPKFGAPKRTGFETPTQGAEGQNALFQEANDMPAAMGPNAVDAAKANVQSFDALEPLVKQFVLNYAADMKPMQLDRLTAQAVDEYLKRDVNPALSDAFQAANAVGRWNEGRTVLDYDARTNFDQALSYVFPFSYWRRAQAWNWAQRFLEKPNLLLAYAKAQQQLDDMTNSDEYPERLRGKLRLPLPFKEKWMGNDIFFDPLDLFIPVKSVYGAEVQRLPFTNAGNALLGLPASDEDVAKLLRKRAARGELNRAEVENAIASKDGEIWENAKQEARQDMASPDNLTGLFTPHAPLQWLIAALTNQSDAIGPLLPQSRAIRQATGALGMNNGEGINIESPVRNILRAVGLTDLPEFDPWEEYRRRRMLANMVDDKVTLNGKTITEKDARLAMLEKRGVWWQEASRRANAERMPFSSILTPTSVLPEGERGIRDAQAQLKKLKQYEVERLGGDANNMTYAEQEELLRRKGAYGKDSAISLFYDNHPELGARAAVFKSPEALLKEWVIDELWTKYNDLSSLDKRGVRAQLGEDFDEWFINKDTRDYDKIDLLDLIRWGQQFDTIIPNVPKGEIETLDLARLDNTRKLQYAPPEVAQAYQDFTTKMQTFDGAEMSRKADEYKALKTTADKREYLKREPMFDAWRQAWGKFYDANPEVKEYLVGVGAMEAQSASAGGTVSKEQQFYQAVVASGLDWDLMKQKQAAYSALPKGTGARTQFLKANGDYKRYYDIRNAFFGDSETYGTFPQSNSQTNRAPKIYNEQDYIKEARVPTRSYGQNQWKQTRWGSEDMLALIQRAKWKYNARQGQ